MHSMLFIVPFLLLEMTQELSVVGVNKASAIEALINHLNIPQENTFAFGDGMNDADMLEYCHIGIAVGNAKEGLKAIADEVCDDIAEDGIYKTMKNINLYKNIGFFPMFFIRVNVSLKWSQVLKTQRSQTYLYMLLQKLH